ncbi:MAG: four-carbon acid sugar kinase family protein [Ferruginibacter sp.]
MIAVFADDFTGAAEIAGLALHFRLTVEICATVNEKSTADLLIISADTRSMDEATAVSVTENIFKSLLKMKPDFIYKKNDSVLRGHILPEIEMQMKLMNADTVLIVPANPSLGRTIKDGNYFLNDTPIHLTSFSKDPEFAISSSDVKEMIKSNGTVSVCKRSSQLPNKGIFIAEVENKNDLDHWASLIKENILPVGGGDFFSALLAAKNIPFRDEIEEAPEFQLPMLFVCGSTFSKAVASIHSIKKNGGPVSYLPAEFLTAMPVNDLLMRNWASETTGILILHGRAIIAIDPETVATGTTALLLRQKMALAVEMLFAKAAVRELFIEGGSTAAAVIDRLGYNIFIPVTELKRGVVRIKVKQNEGLHITVKPGSYDWPNGIWDFEN